MSITPEQYMKRLRRRAKVQGRAAGLPHTEALNAIAEGKGFPHWRALMAAFQAQSFPSAAVLAAEAANVSTMTDKDIVSHLRRHFGQALKNGTILLAADYQFYAGPLSEEGMDLPDWFANEFPDITDRHSDLVHRVGWEIEAEGPWIHRDELRE